MRSYLVLLRCDGDGDGWTVVVLDEVGRLELAGGVEDRDLDGANWRAIA